MENLLNDLGYANKHTNIVFDTEDNILTKEKNVDQESEIENGNLLDYLEIFGYKEDN